MYELIYTDPLCCRGLVKHRSVEWLVQYALKHAREWSIYRPFVNGDRFHNSTDQRFLEIHDDPYWYRRGVPAMTRLESKR